MSLQPLLRSTFFYPHEALLSFQWRLAQCNAYDPPDILQRLIKQHLAVDGIHTDCWHTPRHPQTFHILHQLSRASLSHLYAASGHAMATLIVPPHKLVQSLRLAPDDNRPMLPLSRLASFHLYSGHNVQFCPHCLREASYYSLPWRSKLIAACLRHHCLLATGESLGRQSLTVRQLLDDAPDLSQHATPPSCQHDALGCFAQQLILSWFGFMTPPAQSTLGLLPQCSNPVLYALVYGLSRFLMARPLASALHTTPSIQPTNLQANKTQWQPQDRYLITATAVRALLNWPDNFFVFLDAYRLAHPQANAIQVRFGPLEPYYLHEYWQHPDFDFVRDAFQTYFLRHFTFTPGSYNSKYYRLRPPLAPPLSDVSMTEAARLLNVDRKSVYNYIKARRLPVDTMASTQRIPRTAVLALQSSRDRHLNLIQSAHFLGLKPTVVCELVVLHLLTAAEATLGTTRIRWRFHQQTLHLFLQQLANLTQRQPPQQAYLDFAATCRHLRSISLSPAQLLMAILSQDLPAYSPSQSLQSCQQLTFDPQQLHRFVLAQRRSRGWLTRHELAVQLNVSLSVISHWLDIRVLQPVQQCHLTLYFDLSTVTTFSNQYCLAPEVAQHFGIPLRAVYRHVWMGNLHPCSGRKIDGGPVYLFPRQVLHHPLPPPQQP